MKRFIVAFALAVSLVAGTGTASLAGPPSFQDKCVEAEKASAGNKDFNCDY